MVPACRTALFFAIALSILGPSGCQPACGGSSRACGHSVAPSKRSAATPALSSKEERSRHGASAIDAQLRGLWKKTGVGPVGRADDATFLRRAYVDIVGTIPPPDVVTKFLADEAPTKRDRLVDALLSSPEYVDHWTNYWDDVLMG